MRDGPAEQHTPANGAAWNGRRPTGASAHAPFTLPSIFSIARRLFSHLPTRSRRRFPLIVCGMVILATSEMLALATVALFVSALGTPDAATRGEPLRTVLSMLGVASDLGALELVMGLSAAVVCALALRNVLALVVRYRSALYSAHVQTHIGGELFQRFLDAPYEWHLGKNSSHHIQTIEWRSYAGILVQRLLEGISDLLVLVAITVALVLNQTVTGLLMSGVLGGLAFLMYRRVRRVLRQTIVEIRGLSRQAFDEASSALQGIKEVRVSSSGALFQGRLRGILQRLAPRIAKERVLEMASGWLLETVGFALIAAAIAVLVLVMNRPFASVLATIGTLVVAAWRALPTLNRVVMAGTLIRSSLPFVETVLDYLDHTPREVPSTPGRIRPTLHRNLVLEAVSYRYPDTDRLALRDVSFELKHGHALGLVGRSGAGKSTCADIIAGLLKPSEGSVILDGRTLEPQDANGWIRSVGYVTQQPYLLDASLAENVAVGDGSGSVDERRVLECCELASVDFLLDLPQGVWTRLGERGTRLSGGQRQRVAIARVLYRNPELIIFDEATSSLDAKSERAIRDAIRSFRGRYTVLIIAHRLSSVEECDEVVWLDNGILRAVGPAEPTLTMYTAHGAET